jgi:hypothetical protein
VPRRSRPQHRHFLGRLDQRIELLLLGVEQAVEIALAHAECREHDRIEPPGRSTSAITAAPYGTRSRRLLLAASAPGMALAGPDGGRGCSRRTAAMSSATARVMLHHVQRIVPQRLVQFGERAPGSADGVERSPPGACPAANPSAAERASVRALRAEFLLSSCSRITPSSCVSPIPLPCSAAESSRLPPPEVANDSGEIRGSPRERPGPRNAPPPRRSARAPAHS